MSSSSTDSGTSPPPPLDDDLVKPLSDLAKRVKPGGSSSPRNKPANSPAPLIIAVYRYGDPDHKRRVKVPAHITWSEFLTLLSSRLDVARDCEISTYDENGIEIVSVEDLVPNDVLVVREKPVAHYPRSPGFYPHPARGKQPDDRVQGGSLLRQHKEAPPLQQVSSHSVSMVPSRHPQAPPTGTPQLTHFIKANQFGYYFLAEVEAGRVGAGREGGGEEGGSGRKRVHCVVKVPSCDKSSENSRIFEVESSLLRKVSGHRSIVPPPTIHILNFANEFLQLFFSHLPEHKQPPLTELFFSGTCSEAYIYPLHGVTMATKIKTGLTPEKTVRYAYQLADTMYYLQQRGVIHQTLLPENIQVTSNDKVMVCNFETAVQTEPDTCTLLISHSLVAPSNRMGLSPEVLNTFNRGDAEMVDYSTQYSWNFGSLSVVMATGQYPLKNYPGRYLNEGKVKYRSHNYQSLPDINKYPSLFCRLVKRALSCDPVRRPTLFQITSIMKKDSRTLAMMSSNGRGKTSVGSPSISGVGTRSLVHRRDSAREQSETERNGEQGSPYGRHKHHSLTSAQPPDLPSFSLHEQTVPSKRTKTEPQQTAFPDNFHHHLPSPRLREPHQWSHDSHVVPTYDSQQRSHDNQVRSHDPPSHTPSQQQFSQSYDAGRGSQQYPSPGLDHGRWSDVGTRYSPHVARAMSERGHVRSPLVTAPLDQQRRGSLGGFSDDFSPVAKNFSSSPAHKTVSDVTQSQSSARYSESLHSPQVQRMGRKRSSGTSDSEGNGAMTGESEYQRLIPDDSQDEHLSHQIETDTPQPENQGTGGGGGGEDSHRALLPRPGSAHDVRQVPRRSQWKTRSYEASRRMLRRPSEQVEFRRAASLQQSPGSSTTTSLPPRQCYSDSETRVGGAARLHSSPLLPRAPPSDSHSPMKVFRNFPPWNSINTNSTGSESTRLREREGSSHHRMEETERERGGGVTEPMQVSLVTTHQFEVSDKLSDVSTSAQVGVAAGETTSAQGGRSDAGLTVQPAENVSLEPSVAGQSWSERFEEVGNHQHQMECETHSGDNFGGSHSIAAVRPDFQANSTNAQSGIAPPSQITPQWLPEQQDGSATIPGHDQSQPSVPRHLPVATVYSGPHIMSPIAEVSQEFSTQQTATQNFSASQTQQNFSASQTQHTQFTQSMHSLSPLPEQQNESQLRRSSSPFHHDALGRNTVSAILSPPSAVSDTTSPSVTSHVARVINRADVPQLEPPSTSSDTSHSLTRSSEVDSNHQNQNHYVPPTATGGDMNTNFTSFSRQERVALSTPTNAMLSAQLLSQNFPQNLSERRSQSQVPPTQEPSSASFTPATAAAQSQATPSVPEFHHLSTPSSREDSQTRSLHGSGAYQSTVSDSSRERYGGRQSWSTASAPSPGFVNYHRRNRRSASPTTTHAPSVLSDSVAVQFRAARKQHGHSGQTASEIGDSGSHRGSGRRRHHHRGSLGSSSNGSRHHHQTAQRISQDLEMMTRAIEGMDSGNPMERDRSIGRDDRLSLSPPRAVPQVIRGNQTTNRGAPPTRLSSNSDLRPGYRAIISPLSPPGHLSLVAGRGGLPHTHTDFLFRQSPNPPNSLTSLSQIPPNNESPDMARSDCVTQNLAQSGTPLTQGGEIVPLSPVPSVMLMETQPTEIAIPPPAPGVGSSEYLPPYSPPQQGEQVVNQRAAATVVRQDQPIYRDPPPSYEEIFGQHGGRRQRQRQRRPSRQSRRREDEGAAGAVGGESQSQQDPPTAHRHSRSSGHRKLPSLTSLFRRGRRHTSHDSHPSHPSPRSSRAHSSDHTPQLVPSSHQQEGSPRERPQLQADVSPEPSTLERTASWVASYSQTPRPITAYQQLERGFREFSGRDEASSSISAGGNAACSSVHSQVSRAVSDTTAAMALRQTTLSSSSHSQPTHQLPPAALPGLPSYRHPPPFSPTHPHDPSLPSLQRLGNHNLAPQNSNTSSREPMQYPREPVQPPREPVHSSSQQDSNTRQVGYALSPQDATARLTLSPQDSPPAGTHAARLTNQSNSQHSSPQQIARPAVSPATSTTQQTSHRLSQSSAHSRSLAARPHGQTLNLSQPNLPLHSSNDGGTSSSSQQAPVFHRVLAHPPRTRPISPLVTSAEYGRGLTSPANTADTSEARAVLASAVERLRTQRSTESLRAASSNSQQEMSNTSEQPAPPRQLFLPWQLDAQEASNGTSLGANGNANNDKPPAKSSQNSPNATPKNSPLLSRRIATTAGTGEGESSPPVQSQKELSQPVQSQRELSQHVQSQRESSQPLQSPSKLTENTASQDGYGMSSESVNLRGEGKQSRKSTQRLRAASRRLAQQASSSDEELNGRSSSSSHGRPKHRRKRGNSRSRSSSRQENKNGSLTTPVNTQAPEYFPSFQSQPTELPQDGLFSTVSSDLTAQSTLTSVMSRDSHMTSHQTSHDQQQQQQQEILLTQVQEDALPKPQADEGSRENSGETMARVSHDHLITSPAVRSNERVSTPEPLIEEDTTAPGRQEVGSHDPTCDVTAVVEVAQINNEAGTTEPASPDPSVQAGADTPCLLSSSPHTSTISTASKPCGHVCLAEGERDSCCQCLEPSDHAQSCEICTSRRSLGQVCNCGPNKPNKSCPVHRGRSRSSLPTPIDARQHSHHTHNRKHIKNCIVM